jgi:hypothetical protein
MEDVPGLSTEDERKSALKLPDTFHGLVRHKFFPYVLHVFPDVRDL